VAKSVDGKQVAELRKIAEMDMYGAAFWNNCYLLHAL
jgi:hypothetical protein